MHNPKLHNPSQHILDETPRIALIQKYAQVIDQKGSREPP
jgi:hypothetical protein